MKKGKIIKKKNFWRTGFALKKELTQAGHKARFVESKETDLSSVIVNQEKCQDLVAIFEPEGIYYGRTVAVQDFKDYSHRDYGRPARDSQSGMLPPKLAQMMINLAQAKKDDVILDPFCGSGTILQECLLLGYHNLIGSDLSAKAVADTQKNLTWLQSEKKINLDQVQIFQADAQKLNLDHPVQCLISEVYLGPVKGTIKLEQTLADLKKLYAEIFANLTKLLAQRNSLVIAFPAWRRARTIVYLNIERDLAKLGYQIKDKYLYGRPDAQVLRQIMVLHHRG